MSNYISSCLTLKQQELLLLAASYSLLGFLRKITWITLFFLWPATMKIDL